MLSFGLGFDEARASNLVLVDDDLQLLEGDGMVNPSNRFHLWIYRHRPNVNAIVHTHPPYCSALSVAGQPLIAAHMDTAMFYDDCAYLAEWPGPPIGDEEGQIIHEALGDKRAILLAHHGQLVATSTIEEAAVLAVFIERAARMQVLAQSIGTIKPIDPAYRARGARLPAKAARRRRDLPLLRAPRAQARARRAGVAKAAKIQPYRRNGVIASTVSSANSSCTESFPRGSRTLRMPGSAASASISASDLCGVSLP